MTTKNDQIINKFINFANETIACGPSCKRERKIQNLKEKYETTKREYQNGEQRIEAAEKEYLTYAKGDIFYYQMLRDKNKQKAINNMNKKEKNYEKKINELRNKQKDNNILSSNLLEIKEYHQNLVDENKEIEDNINEFKKIVYTSDRKAYYENEELKSIKEKISIYKIIHFTIFTLLIFYVLLHKRDFRVNTLLRLAFFLSMPFVGIYIINKFLELLNFILSFFPDNVYKKIIVFNEGEKLDEKGLLRMSLM